jgi:toxin secretion/phage lysis holin
MKNFISFVGGSVLTGLSYLLGGFDGALLTLAIVMALDYITGICKAVKQKTLNSKVGFMGILKKFGYFVIVALAVIIDRLAGDTGAIRTIVIYFFVANDGLSILENWGSIGLPLPKKLFEVLEQLKNENNPDNDPK